MNESKISLIFKYPLQKYIQSILLPGEGNGTPLQYPCLENPTDGGTWWAAVHGVAQSRTWLSDFTFTFHFHALEKEMATHSSVLAWRIAGMGKPGGLPSMGSHRVGHDWSDLAYLSLYYYHQSCLEQSQPILLTTITTTYLTNLHKEAHYSLKYQLYTNLPNPTQ